MRLQRVCVVGTGIFVGEGIVKEHLARTLWALVLGGAGVAYGLGLGTMALAGTG